MDGGPCTVGGSLSGRHPLTRSAPSRVSLTVLLQLAHGSACYARDLSGHFDQPWWLPVDGAGGPEMSLSDPCLIRSGGPSGEAVVRLGGAAGR
jgi:hypothetical protein